MFQHATEDHDRVAGALGFVSGTKVLREIRADGYHGNPIVVLEAELGGRKELDEFWERVRQAGLAPSILENLEERVNEEGELFLRFDKQEAVAGRLSISSGEDVIAARGRVLTRSGGREVRAPRDDAVREMRAFLSELGAG